MSAIINVFFASMSGSKHSAQLKVPYTFDDIKKIVYEKFHLEQYRLIVNGKEMREDEHDKFEELKKTIKNNTTIYVCQRLIGGSC